MNSREISLWMGIAILGLCAGCAVKPQQSLLLGDCQELLVPQRVWEGREDAFMGRVLLTSIDKEQIFWRKQVIGSLDAGTQVRIAKVLKDWNGSWGHFLRVKVEILDGPFRGQIAEVPSIAPSHPRPRWVVEPTLDPNALQFNPEIVKPCNA